jgi:hypothetical protein
VLCAADIHYTYIAHLLTGTVLRFPLFVRNDVRLLYALFWLFSIALSSFAHAIGAVMRHAQTATYAGFAVFIVGWVCQTTVRHCCSATVPEEQVIACICMLYRAQERPILAHAMSSSLDRAVLLHCKTQHWCMFAAPHSNNSQYA